MVPVGMPQQKHAESGEVRILKATTLDRMTREELVEHVRDLQADNMAMRDLRNVLMRTFNELRESGRLRYDPKSHTWKIR